MQQSQRVADSTQNEGATESKHITAVYNKEVEDPTLIKPGSSQQETKDKDQEN